jgi:hypothetical protein
MEQYQIRLPLPSYSLLTHHSLYTAEFILIRFRNYNIGENLMIQVHIQVHIYLLIF